MMDYGVGAHIHTNLQNVVFEVATAYATVNMNMQAVSLLSCALIPIL